jgi:putative oxidoreductase
LKEAHCVCISDLSPEDKIMIGHNKNLEYSLLFLRLSVFLVMFMWTIDKFINPEHTAGIYESFYYIAGLETALVYAIGTVEIILLLMFLAGYKKLYSYGIVLAIHAISTLSSFKQYLAPFDGANLLFFAAWPMLAACLTLFMLRDEDKKLSID